MLAQLLKNLYICTFLFFFPFCTCGQTKAGSGHSDGKESGTGRKMKDPAHQHNKPIPTPQKVKTAMQAPPMSGGSADGVEKENKNKETNQSAPFFHSIQEKKKSDESKVCGHKY